MNTYLLIVHGLCSVALLGAITHQAFAICWPARKAIGLQASFRSVNAAKFTNGIVALYIVAFVLGAVIYPAYRLAVRTYFESARMWNANGSFELKEQFAVLALGMLPFYWTIWRQPLDPAFHRARQATTAVICFVVWYGFLVGHVLNNIRGLYGQ